MKLSLSLLTTLFFVASAEGFMFRGSTKKISIQELQSPAGPKHSDGIALIIAGGDPQLGTTTGMVWFANDLVVPGTVEPDDGTGADFEGGTPMGTQTGRK